VPLSTVFSLGLVLAFPPGEFASQDDNPLPTQIFKEP
jgi:hypothetical protein